MIQHCTHPVSEIALVGFSLISLAASRLILADALPAQQFALQWFLLPLIGALCSSVCAMLLNPNPEARKVVFARSIFGVVSGTGIPKIVSMVHPALKEVSLDPAVAFLAGFFVCIFAYVVSRPFVTAMYARSGSIANTMAQGIQTHVEQTVKQVSVTKTTVDPTSDENSQHTP